MKKLVSIFLLFLGVFAYSQEKQYAVQCIGFYNLENLFDTIANNELGRDLEYTPDGEKKWNTTLYNEKLHNMSEVISKIGTELSPVGVSLLGVSEVENRTVLEDLVMMPALATRGYKIVHNDSPDRRGIDVALLYNPKFFNVINYRSARLHIDSLPDFRTRDQLVVSGELDGELIHVIVNHWPSRYGGEKRSRPLRNAAADLTKSISDSILNVHPKAKIIIMGDLNDDPINESVQLHLGAVDNKNRIKDKELLNPTMELFKDGIGTLAYRDNWNLFDQIIISGTLVNSSSDKYTFHKVKIFNEEFLKVQEGRYKGYPNRTHVGNSYKGGYSDHFPVYMFLLKEI